MSEGSTIKMLVGSVIIGILAYIGGTMAIQVVALQSAVATLQTRIVTLEAGKTSADQATALLAQNAQMAFGRQSLELVVLERMLREYMGERSWNKYYNGAKTSVDAELTKAQQAQQPK